MCNFGFAIDALAWVLCASALAAANTSVAPERTGAALDRAAVHSRSRSSRGRWPDKPFLGVLMFDAKRALVIGAYGLAYATADGGATWTSWRSRLDKPKGLNLYAVRQRGERIVISGERGLLLHSGDGGQTFKRLTSPYQGSYFTAELPAENTIVIASGEPVRARTAQHAG